MSETSIFEPERPNSLDVAWCPGCGNFGIKNILKKAFTELNLKPNEIAIVSGIGQAAKMVHYINVNAYHSLHGRSVPIATAVKAMNPNLTVFAEGGDGDMYAEGGNHLLHAFRRNPDMVILVHNNQIYGLTKGQGSPTTATGQITTSQPFGVSQTPYNAVASAVVCDASFVARTFMGFMDESVRIIKDAIKHKGLSFVEIFHPCVSFNKINDYKWYKEHTYFLKNHNSKDRKEAILKAMEEHPFPLGIFYEKDKPTFEDSLKVYERDQTPLYERSTDMNKIKKLVDSFH